MQIKQSLITQDKYSVKCPYEMKAEGITVHNTANDASAANEIAYLKSNNNEVSYHIAIDDIEAIQVIPFNRNTWHAGDGGSGKGNRKHISIEICYSKSGGPKFTQAEKNAAIVIANLLKQFGWGIEKVTKHQDFSGKYCPHRTLDLGWNRFLDMVKAELNKSESKTTVYRVRKTWDNSTSQIGAFTDLNNAKKMVDANKGYKVFNESGVAVYPVVEQPKPSITTPVQNSSSEYIIEDRNEIGGTGKFTCTADKIYFRNKPIISNDNPIAGNYTKGESVVYDRVVITNKYIYISWISASTGIRRYMPITDKTTKETWGYCI